HDWLATKHGAVERANLLWGTSYRSFAEVAAPPVKDSRPLPGTNRALWYDWARFNQDRFTEYLLWVRGEVRKLDARMPLAAGGSNSHSDVGEVLRVAHDVRRLNKEIAAFVEAPAEVAILYSQTSTLQLPPEMLTWQTTPYLAEVNNTYQASQFLDAKVTFVTE